MKSFGGGEHGLWGVLICALFMCGCNVGSTGPIDVVLREVAAEPVRQPLTDYGQVTELLLSCREAVPNCLLEGSWPESLSSSEIKTAVEELVDLYWRCNYFDLVRKGLHVTRPVVASELGSGPYETHVRISKRAVAGQGSGGEEASALSFQSGFATLSIDTNRSFVVSNPVVAILGDVLALISENCGVRCCLKDGKIVICPFGMGNDSHYGNEYENLTKALMENSSRRTLPYGKSMVRWWNAFDKLRQEEYTNAKNGVVFPLGCHSRDKIIKNAIGVPKWSFVKRLKVALGNDRKSLLHTCKGEDQVLCSVDSSAYAVLNVRMENVDTVQEMVSVKQLPPSIDLFKHGVPEGEMLLVFTPQGFFARPWYCNQFNYYCFLRDECLVL